MATIVGIVTVTSFVYSLEVREILPKGKKYYFLFLFMTTGLYGVFLTGDIINRYVFFELTILTTYVLLTYTDSKESLRASFIYLMIGSVASLFFLVGIGLLYFNTGHLDLHVLSKIIPQMTEYKRNLIFTFFLVAISVKSGLIPFHTWLPDAHVSAPSPMTAVLAGITVKTGIYILIKFLSIGFLTNLIQNVMIFLGLITAILAVIISLTYWDLKRILAWNTICQMGLLAAVISLWSPLAVSAGLYHMVSHALFKVLLFLTAGAMFYLYGTRDIRELPLEKSDPILVGSLFIGILSIVGIPPLSGFYSKSLLLTSINQEPLMYGCFILVHILTIASFTRIVYYSSKEKGSTYIPTSILTPIAVLAGLCVFIGATSTIWMDNVVYPSALVLVEKTTVTHLELLEIDIIKSLHGFLILICIPVGIAFTSVVEKVNNICFKNIITKVDIPDSIRYIILVIALYLLLIIL